MALTTFKALTLNMHKGFSSFNRRYILHKLKEDIQLVNADIVFLQEVLGEHSGLAKKHGHHWPNVSQYEFLAKDIWHSYAYGRNAVYPTGHHGNALLCRFPITTWENHDISSSGNERRGLLQCEIDIGGQLVYCICVHLSLRERDRRLQFNALNSLVNHIPRQFPVIVAGDFNDWRGSAHRILKAGSHLDELFKLSNGLPERTFPAFFPTLRLDRIYTRGISTYKIIPLPRAPWSTLSDHKPLLVEISLSN